MTKRQWLLALVKRVRVTGPLPGTSQPIEINPRLCRILLKMKLRELSKLSAVALLVFGLTGCETPEQKQMTCKSAESTYMAYRAAIEAGHTPSKEEIVAVAGAAQFLRMWCGWEITARNPWCPMDHNLVPILNKP